MDWLTSGGSPTKPSSPSSGFRGSADEQSAMIDILKGKYEEVALKLQEETQEKERILAELRTLQKRGSSTDVLEAIKHRDIITR